MAGNAAKGFGKVIQGVVRSANPDTFTRLDTVEADAEVLERVVRVLEMQEFITVVSDAQGNKTIKLTPSGVEMLNSLS